MSGVGGGGVVVLSPEIGWIRLSLITSGGKCVT